MKVYCGNYLCPNEGDREGGRFPLTAASAQPAYILNSRRVGAAIVGRSERSEIRQLRPDSAVVVFHPVQAQATSDRLNVELRRALVIRRV
jgi:hypothetical protein